MENTKKLEILKIKKTLVLLAKEMGVDCNVMVWETLSGSIEVKAIFEKKKEED